MAEPIPFRCRRDRAADSTLEAGKGLREAITGLEDVAASVVRTKEMSPELAEAMRIAADLVDTAAKTLLDVALGLPAEVEGLEQPA